MSKNDITGDRLVSKPATDAYAEGHDRIFGNKGIAKEVLEMVYAVSLETVAPHTYLEPMEDDGPGEEDGPWAEGWAERAGLPKPPKGYTAEELDADNPYNNWMNEK